MKKIRLLVIAMTLGVSGLVHAGTPPQIEKMIVAQSDSNASVASFSSNAGQPVAQNFNYVTKVSAPFYLESDRVSHVPEPEGWAMMLMGVGFVVYQVRRRKRARESWDLR